MSAGFATEVKGKPHYRVVVLPVGSPPYYLQNGVRVLDHQLVVIGRKTFMRLLMDIENESGPQLPSMPRGWDFRDFLKEKL